MLCLKYIELCCNEKLKLYLTSHGLLNVYLSIEYIFHVA